jgi:hypothetical protein
LFTQMMNPSKSISPSSKKFSREVLRGCNVHYTFPFSSQSSSFSFTIS